jgi:hypothetical protein
LATRTGLDVQAACGADDAKCVGRTRLGKTVANKTRNGYIGSMAKESSTKRSSSTGVFVTVTSAVRTRNVTTKLGEVTVRGARPSREMIAANVMRSTQALERAGEKLIKPGVHLPEKKGVPRYSADENRPGLFIRRLNGQITTGRLQNGQFVESK